MTDPILSVEDLQVSFRTDDGLVRAVRGVSFDVQPGETLGLVGESGSGKSVTNLALMGLVPTPPGQVDGGSALYGGQDLLALSTKQLRSIRGRKISMIFQDPMTALNPLMTVGQQITEITRLHLSITKTEADRKAIEVLEMVGIPSAERRLRDYPHEFSGGMRQRVMIAMALSCEPDLLIADEPTTALDVTIQAQILELLADLQKRRGTSIILITHDLGVVAEVCDRVIVMYAGRIVEQAGVKELFASPKHPYTQGLLESLPNIESTSDTLTAIPGQPPDLAHIPSGCAFQPRCPYQQPACLVDDPELKSVDKDRWAACLIDIDQAARSRPPVELQELAPSGDEG